MTQRERVIGSLEKIGSLQSRLEVVGRTLLTMSDRFAGAEARIRDADFALDSAEAVRLQILQEAGTEVLRQANMQPSIALSLLSS